MRPFGTSATIPSKIGSTPCSAAMSRRGAFLMLVLQTRHVAPLRSTVGSLGSPAVRTVNATDFLVLSTIGSANADLSAFFASQNERTRGVRARQPGFGHW